MIAAGQRVRHRKQAGWGVGVVAQVKPAGALVELTIDFDSGQRLLKLKPDVIAAMIEVLSDDENAALDEQEAATEKAAQAEAKARKARMKSSKLEPRARLDMRCLALIETHDGNAMIATDGDGSEALRIYGPDASVVEDIRAPEPHREYATFSPGPRFVPSELITDGNGLFVGKRTHNSEVVLARRGMKTARLWEPPVPMSLIRIDVHPGTDPVVHDSTQIFIARDDGDSTDQVPIALDKRHIGGAVGWGDGVLVTVHGPASSDEYFNYLYLGSDGAIRHQGAGMAATPIDDQLMVTYDHRGVLARDREGKPVGYLNIPVTAPSSMNRKEIAFARFDDELVFVLGGEEQGLVRWHPHVDQPRWVAKLTKQPQVFAPPIRVGKFLAVTTDVYAEIEEPNVWIVDGETGALVHALPLKKSVSKLVAVGDDALFACSFSKQPVAWRGLSTAKPERLMLTLPSECHDAVSPAPGVVITSQIDSVAFFEL